jgi:hypothetical protein
MPNYGIPLPYPERHTLSRILSERIIYREAQARYDQLLLVLQDTWRKDGLSIYGKYDEKMASTRDHFTSRVTRCDADVMHNQACRYSLHCIPVL